MPDELYERLLYDLTPAHLYEFADAVANTLAQYVNWEPLAFAIRAGLETLPLKEPTP